MKSKIIIITLIILILLVNSVLFTWSIYYYNPDSNITNYNLLTRIFNDYCRLYEEDINLQTFINIDTLFNQAGIEQPDFMLIPYFNYVLKKNELLAATGNSTLKSSNVLTPILKSGKQTYKKIVLVLNTSSYNVILDVAGNIGSVSYGIESQNFIKEYIFSEVDINFDNINFVWVRKDIDNLYALMFNQVNAIIVSDKVYNELKDDNNFLVQNVKVIYESADIPEVVVTLTNDEIDSKILAKTKEMFLNMHLTKEGQELLNLLGYKKWLSISL